MFAVDGSHVVGWCDVFIGQKPGFEHAGNLGMGVLKSYRAGALDIDWFGQLLISCGTKASRGSS